MRIVYYSVLLRRLRQMRNITAVTRRFQIRTGVHSRVEAIKPRDDANTDSTTSPAIIPGSMVRTIIVM